jgi:hypothetical protein
MLVNEIPRVRRAGDRLRLGLYAFCVISFLNYFVPVLLGRMSGWVFLLALSLSAGVVWLVADRLAAGEADPRKARAFLFAPGAAVCLLVGGLYVFRLIPPVPSSVQFQGIYHDVRREDGSFVLTYEKPPLHLFWRHDSRPFRKGPGDRLHYFVRVFAPTDSSTRSSPAGRRRARRVTGAHAIVSAYPSWGDVGRGSAPTP